MKLIALLLLAAFSAFGQLPPKEAAEGWVMLFDGQSDFGWTAEGDAQWRTSARTLIADGTGSGQWRSNAIFGDFILKLDFRHAKDGSCGVIIRSGTPIEFKRVKPKAEVWHTMEVEAVGNRFQVKLNGKKAMDAQNVQNLTGYIGLRASEGKRIEYRNVLLKPLGLAPLFNGKDLSGWKVFDTPQLKEPAVWSVKDGALHVERGPGQIETEKTFQNFALQLDIRTNTQDPKRHPNSGVFLRGAPGGWWTGYESQIFNGFQDNDPAKVLDYGTGGIYFYSNARKIVAKDNEFFTETVVANGRRISVWINGYQVTDFSDTNPEGDDVQKKQAKLAVGTISLQAHDPTTNLDFKNIRAAELK